MKNEALHRQTVRPNSVINKNSRNLGEKEGGYFCLFCVRMDGHDYLKYAVLLVSYGTGQTGALAREKRSYVCVWGASLAE